MMSCENKTGRAFDLTIKSLSHKFSVYGHRFFNFEEDEVAPSPVYCTMVEKSGKYVMTGADDYLIKVWDARSGTLAATLAGHSAEICDMSFSPCMQYFASLCSEDFSVVVWKKSADGPAFHALCRVSEADPTHPSRKLKPLYMEFSPADEVPVAPRSLKLILAFTNGTIIVYELIHDALITFNSVRPKDTIELKSFAQLRCEDGVSVVAGVARGSAKAIVCYTIRARGTPSATEYVFPSTLKSAISHISVANLTSSFVANDDDVSSVVLWKDTGKREFEKLVLLKGMVSGDALLVDQSSLIERLREIGGPAVIYDQLRITVDITVWTKNDEFILCSISGCRIGKTSIAEEDEDSIYVCLIFESGFGRLVGAVGLGINRDHIFNVGPVKAPSTVAGGWSYFFTGSYDGSLSFWKIRSSIHGLLVEELTGFNVNTDRGTNRPRSILDCEVLERDDGHIVFAASDSRGGVSVFSTETAREKMIVCAEQFFQNDYTARGAVVPLGQRVVGVETEIARTTTAASGGVVCDSRLLPVSQLETPSPPLVHIVDGTGFRSRLNGSAAVLIKTLPEREPVKVPVSVAKQPGTVGRPPLTDQERARRAESLRSLAAARAARVDNQGRQEEYIRTASGRITRRMERYIPEDEFELYENSEIDDSSFSNSEASSSSDDDDDVDMDDDADVEPPARTSPVRRSQRAIATPVRISSRSDQSIAADVTDTPSPTKMRQDQFVARARALQAGSAEPLTCTLCEATDDSSRQLLGPFPIADLPDCYFHSECLFTLSGLTLLPPPRRAGPTTLTLGNLDRLVHAALRGARCGGCRNRRGAGIKCAGCRAVFHYPCALAVAAQAGRLVDPVYDNYFICARCEPGEDAAGLDAFSRRRKWRKEEQMRSWLLRTDKSNTHAFVPQLGDLVYYYPPKPDWGRGTAAQPVGEAFQLALSDLALQTWWTGGVVPARVEKIEYVFPGFFDFEKFAIIHKLTLSFSGSSPDVATMEGLTFTLHYRPRTNACDCLVPRDRVDRALASGFLQTARVGLKVNLPVDLDDDESDNAESSVEVTITQLLNDAERPGWECFQIKQFLDDGSPVLSVVSLWELDLDGIAGPTTIRSVPSPSKAQFVNSWIDRMVAGPVARTTRSRIQIPDRISIFAPPPWTSPGADRYLEVIAYPVWLDLVKARLAAGFYRSLAEVERDISCVSRNCGDFNDPNSQLVKDSEVLVQTLLMLLRLPEEDHPLFAPPPLPAAPVTVPESPVSRIRLRSLTCSNCGAARVVGRESYDRFNGKRVVCRNIGFACGNAPGGRLATISAPPATISTRSGRTVRRRVTSNSTSSEESISSVSSDSSSSSGDSGRRGRRRGSKRIRT